MTGWINVQDAKHLLRQDGFLSEQQAHSSWVGFPDFLRRHGVEISQQRMGGSPSYIARRTFDRLCEQLKAEAVEKALLSSEGSLQWKSSVPYSKDLPSTAVDGEVRYVDEEDTIHVWFNGCWKSCKFEERNKYIRPSGEKP